MNKNYFYCQILRHEKHPETPGNPNQFCLGKVSIAVHRHTPFRSISKNFHFDDQRKVLVSMIGYIINFQEVCEKYGFDIHADLELILQLYLKKGIRIISELQGIYMIFIYDYTREKGFVLQSEFGLNLPVYYCKTPSEISICTRLSPLISLLEHKDLNIEAAREFLHFISTIPSRHTLIHNVYKITANNYLVIDTKRNILLQHRYRFTDKGHAGKNDDKMLLHSIATWAKKLVNGLKANEYAVTHTGGWDTNFLLFILHSLEDKNITAITINGGELTNELPVVLKIQTCYPALKSLSGNIGNIMDSLVDLVCIYEGYLFQEGMFLRHELSKLLSENKLSAVVMGTCADQILYPPQHVRNFIRTYPDLKYIIERLLHKHCTKERLLRKKIGHKTVRITYNTDIDMLLKMHEIALNEFGIIGLYPYINKETVQISRKLGNRNKNKAFYKSEIKKMLPEKIVNLLCKSQHVVDIKNLFNVEANFGIIQKALHTDLTKQILKEDKINEVSKAPQEFHLLILQIIYINVFNEIFLTNRFHMGSYEKKPATSIDEIFH